MTTPQPADRSPLDEPPRHIVEDGHILRYGMFAGRIAEPNLQDTALYGLRSGSLVARARFKQWQHLCVVHDDLAITLAVVDAGITRLGWVQVIDRRTGERVEHHRQSPLLAIHVAERLGDGDTWLRASGLRVALRARLDEGRHDVEVTAPQLEIDLTCHATTTPLEVVLPLGRGRGMWSHKVPLPVSGTVRWRGRTVELDRTVATGIFDIHKAHYPHHTWWRWATFVGRDEEGRRLAVNLTRNPVIDPGLHECALWLDGGLRSLPLPEFHLEREPWRITAPELDLRFDGDGERREDLDVVVVRSRFRQRYGTFSGTVGGRRVEAAFGLFEDHDSRW